MFIGCFRLLVPRLKEERETREYQNSNNLDGFTFKALASFKIVVNRISGGFLPSIRWRYL